MCRKHNESVIISCYEFGLGNMLSQSYNEFAKLVDSGYNSVIVDVVDTTAFNNGKPAFGILWSSSFEQLLVLKIMFMLCYIKNYVI